MAKVSTNSITVKKAINQHILDCVYDDNCEPYTNVEDAKNRLRNEFERVANHENNIKRIPNDQARFQDYLQGIPFNFYFQTLEIEVFLNSLGINPEGVEYDSDRIHSLYARLIFRQMNSSVKYK